MRVRALTLALLVCASSAGAQSASIEPFRDPNRAAIKSVLVPGWGQFGNGESGKGTGLIVGAAVGLLLASDTVSFWSGGSGADLERGLGWLIYGLGAIAGGYDAYKNADRLNRENGYLLDEAARAWPARDETVQVVVLRRRF